MVSAGLRTLATAFGIDTEFADWQGRPQSVTAATLQAVLAAFGVDASTDDACTTALAALERERSARVLPPSLVIRGGQALRLPGGVASARVELEDGTAVDVAGDPPADLPLGYHRLIVEVGGAEHSCPLIVTPESLPLPGALGAPVWGLATQLYSVRSAGSWGIGDLGDLQTIATWSATQHGADFVLVNPLHAAEVVAPMTASPYLPTTRRFANPVYLPIEQLPDYAGLPPADRAEVDALARQARSVSGELIDRDAAWAAKRSALERIFAVPRSAGREASLRGYCAREGAELDRFATWCVLTELYGADWHGWAPQLRQPGSTAVARVAEENSARVEFYRWVQWQLDEQLARVQSAARAAGMRLGVIHDVAVGVSPDGADAWAWQGVLAREVTAGAPPDAYSQLGQDWNQPPWRPDRLAELGYAPLRDLFRNALRHSGGLRVDHIIGLFRLWWIPAGAGADAGTYVHYDHEALIGILCLEAARAGAVIIGEDLGNVEASTRTYLSDRGLFGTSILWFESADGRPLAPQRWREHCLASVTTHDLPPTTGYLAGDHIRLRDQLGLLTRSVDEETAADDAAKAAWLDELRRCGLLATGPDPDPDRIVLALHEFLRLTPSLLRCVALTDCAGERRTQNQPGTGDDQYPNWQVPLGGPAGRPVTLEQLVDDPRAAAVLDAVR